MWERRDLYRVLVRKPEGKRPLGRTRRRWEDNLKMDLQEVNWIDVAQDSARWRALVNDECKAHYAEYNTLSRKRYTLLLNTTQFMRNTTLTVLNATHLVLHDTQNVLKTVF